MKKIIILTLAFYLLTVSCQTPKVVSVESINSLIVLGLNIDEKDNDGWTSLIIAANAGQFEEATLLIEAGADVNAQDLGGGTALLEANIAGNKDIINLLEENGAND